VVTRFLLDQNFPHPVIDIHSLDARVQYQHLDDFDRRLAATSTPDWMVYLAAQVGAFHGIVTRDRSQLQQDEEIVALTRTSLTVVTWRRPIEDPVTEWGQLLAYMPQILKVMHEVGPAICLLPEPRLAASGVDKPINAARRRAAEQRRTVSELRSETYRSMRTELRKRKREDLEELLM
jgi:hypothetical protein